MRGRLLQPRHSSLTGAATDRASDVTQVRYVWLTQGTQVLCIVPTYERWTCVWMSMAAANKTSNSTRAGAHPLRGPVLGLLINQDQPRHAYKLTGLLKQCLPAWQVSRASVGEALKQLEQEGLVSSIEGRRTVYRPIDGAQIALDEWMEQSVSTQPVREELQARIVSSCPHHAPLLLNALEVFEQQCYARLDETPGAEANVGSWKSLTINIVRAAEDEDIHAKIKWAKTARTWLNDYGTWPQNS